MGIRFLCPNGHRLNVKGFLAGKRGVCPHCGAKMRIPLESTITRDVKGVPPETTLDEADGSDLADLYEAAGLTTGADPTTPGAGPSAASGSGMHPATAPNSGPKTNPAAPSNPATTSNQAHAGGGSSAPNQSAPNPAAANQTAPTQAAPTQQNAPGVSPAPGTLGDDWTEAVHMVDRPAGGQTPGASTAAIGPGPAAATQAGAHPDARNLGQPYQAGQSLPGGPTSIDPLQEAPDAVWYVRLATGVQFGPAGAPVMSRWLAEGRVPPDSLVWREGWPQWRAAMQVFPQSRPVQNSGPMGHDPSVHPGPVGPYAGGAPNPGHAATQQMAGSQAAAPSGLFAAPGAETSELSSSQAAYEPRGRPLRSRRSRIVLLVGLVLCILVAAVVLAIVVIRGPEGVVGTAGRPAVPRTDDHQTAQNAHDAHDMLSGPLG
jgi:hypothetical protein